MATFYIQLENRLLQISGELTAENISKALGYVPVSPNVTDELSQRVDNITFDSLKDNPFLQDGSGELNIVDEAGNIIAKVNAEGIHSVDFIAGEHRLSNKTDKAYVDEAVKNVEVDLTGYATEEYVNNIDFYNIKDNPIVNNGDGKLLFVDENGYIGLQLEEDGLYVKDVIADGHTLSQKADKSELSNYATKDEVSDLVDMSVVTELQGKVNTLIDTDADKSVRDIAVDVLTETLVSETATEAYDTLAEMSDWIKSHPEDAAAMNTAIQKNATDITNLNAAYKAADVKVLTDAQEYTDNINFYTIKDNPIVDGEAGSITFVDETGYIGLKVTEDGIIAKDVVTPEHTLSNKADKSELPTKVSELENDSKFITIEDIPEVTVPTKTSDLTNDSGFITINDVPEVEIPSLDEYVKSEDLPNFDDYASKEWVNNKNYATEYDLNNIDYSSIKNAPVSEDETGELNITDENGNIGMKVASEAVYAKDFVAGEHKLSEKVDKTYVDNSIAELVDGAPETLDTLNELAAALNDNADIVDVLNQSISNKQDAITDLETIRQGAAKGATALQSYTEQYKGTVTGVKINGTTKSPSSGVVDLGTVITAHQDISGKQDKLKVVKISNLTITDLNSEVVINLTDEQNSLLVYDDTVILMSFMFPGATYASRCVLYYSLTSRGKSYTGITSRAVSFDKKGDNIFVKAVRDNTAKTLTISFSDIIVTKDSLKTINGQSLIGSGDITISGGSSNANVQAVDTGDVIDDVTVDYATKTYVDGLVGDINSILESIINGNEINEVVVNIVETYLAAPVPKENIYDVICVLSKPLDVKQTATLYYLDGENQPQTLSLVVEYGQTEFVFEQVMINHIEPDMYSVVIGEIEEEDANGIKVTLRSNFKFKYVYS